MSTTLVCHQCGVVLANENVQRCPVCRAQRRAVHVEPDIVLPPPSLVPPLQLSPHRKPQDTSIPNASSPVPMKWTSVTLRRESNDAGQVASVSPPSARGERVSLLTKKGFRMSRSSSTNNVMSAPAPDSLPPPPPTLSATPSPSLSPRAPPAAEQLPPPILSPRVGHLSSPLPPPRAASSGMLDRRSSSNVQPSLPRTPSTPLPVPREHHSSGGTSSGSSLSSSPAIRPRPASMVTPPRSGEQPTTPRSAAVAAAAAAAASTAEVPVTPRGELPFVGGMAGGRPVLLRALQPFVRVAKSGIPSKGGSVRLLESGGTDWPAALPHLTLEGCVEVIVFWLRGLDKPLLTPDLCRWFLDVDASPDARHRARLYCSLFHCLPRANRLCMRLICALLPRDVGVLPLLEPLGPALLGLPAGVPAGVSLVAFLQAPGTLETVFLNTGTRWKTEITEDDNVEKVEFRGLIGMCPQSEALDLLCDPYYGAIIEPDFMDMLTRMEAYVWATPSDVLLAINVQMRRFLGPMPWAQEARLRLLVFTVALIRAEGASQGGVAAWAQRFGELHALVQYDYSNMAPDDPVALREAAQMVLAYAPSSSNPQRLGASFGSAPAMDLLDVKPRLAAGVLMRQCLDPFSRLTWMHLVKQRWLDEEKSPPFAELVGIFNGLHAWAVGWVLACDAPRERASRLAWCLQCAHQSRKLGNFHAAFALYFASSDPAVARLARTWKMLPSKALSHFADLKSLGDSKNNHSVYAGALREAGSTPPVVPYMALVSKYLFTFEEANSTHTDDAKSIINLVKVRMIHTYLEPVLALRQNHGQVLDASMTLAEQNLLQFFAASCAAGNLDNQALYARSLELEPRESE